jgi:hypothetical protein
VFVVFRGSLSESGKYALSFASAIQLAAPHRQHRMQAISVKDPKKAIERILRHLNLGSGLAAFMPSRVHYQRQHPNIGKLTIGSSGSRSQTTTICSPIEPLPTPELRLSGPQRFSGNRQLCGSGTARVRAAAETFAEPCELSDLRRRGAPLERQAGCACGKRR